MRDWWGFFMTQAERQMAFGDVASTLGFHQGAKRHFRLAKFYARMAGHSLRAPAGTEKG